MTLNHRYLKIRSLGWLIDWLIFHQSCHKQSPRTGKRQPKLKLPKCNCRLAGWSIMICFVNVFLSSFNHRETKRFSTAYYCATAELIPGCQLLFLWLKLLGFFHLQPYSYIYGKTFCSVMFVVWIQSDPVFKSKIFMQLDSTEALILNLNLVW